MKEMEGILLTLGLYPGIIDSQVNVGGWRVGVGVGGDGDGLIRSHSLYGSVELSLSLPSASIGPIFAQI